MPYTPRAHAAGACSSRGATIAHGPPTLKPTLFRRSARPWPAPAHSSRHAQHPPHPPRPHPTHPTQTAPLRPAPPGPRPRTCSSAGSACSSVMGAERSSSTRQPRRFWRRASTALLALAQNTTSRSCKGGRAHGVGWRAEAGSKAGSRGGEWARGGRAGEGGGRGRGGQQGWWVGWVDGWVGAQG